MDIARAEAAAIVVLEIVRAAGFERELHPFFGLVLCSLSFSQ